jgi:hypothetical protein
MAACADVARVTFFQDPGTSGVTGQGARKEDRTTRQSDIRDAWQNLILCVLFLFVVVLAFHATRPQGSDHRI